MVLVSHVVASYVVATAQVAFYSWEAAPAVLSRELLWWWATAPVQVPSSIARAFTLAATLSGSLNVRALEWTACYAAAFTSTFVLVRRVMRSSQFGRAAALGV